MTPIGRRPNLPSNPAGLASALAKLERRTGRFWEEMFLPGRRIPEPSLLRTHPPTEERILSMIIEVGPCFCIQEGPRCLA
jgi:heat shock protein HtpX